MHVSEEINNDVILLKKHLIEKLQPSIFEVSKTWKGLIRSNYTIDEFKGKVNNETLKKNSDLSNKLSENMNQLRSEIQATTVFLNEIKDSTLVNKLQDYLKRLDRPFNKTVNDMFESNGNLHEIQSKYYQEMYELEKEFNIIYKDILKL